MNEFITQWHSLFFDADRIPYAVAAILVTIVIGMITGPFIGTGNANPFSWITIDRVFGWLGDRLNKTHRPRADLLFRGFLLTIIVTAIAFGAGRFWDGFIATAEYQSIIEVLTLSLFISSGTIWFALLRLYFVMEQKDGGLKENRGAYFAISKSTRSNLSIADDFAITRTAMNFAAKSFDKTLVAPILWYLIAGLPALCIYTALSALSWRFGKQGLSKGFGETANALEKLMGFVPDIISGILIILAGLFTPTAKLHKGILAFFGHKDRAGYEQGGAPLSAMAWSLSVSLGGPVQNIDGSAIKAPWVGPEGATAKNDHKHLRRAIYVHVLATILFIVLLLSLYMWSGVLAGDELEYIKLS